MRRGGNNKKSGRINEEVLRELSIIIREELKDPRIDPICSVTRVNVSPDLKTAKAYISVLGDADSLARTMEGIESSKGYIRRLLAERINLRSTPEITYIADDSIAYGIEMSKKIDALNHHHQTEGEDE